MVEFLPWNPNDLVSDPSTVTKQKVSEVRTRKVSVVALALNLRTQEKEVGRSVPSQPGLHSKFPPRQPELHSENLSPKRQNKPGLLLGLVTIITYIAHLYCHELRQEDCVL